MEASTTYVIYFPELNILQEIPTYKKLKAKLGQKITVLVKRKNKTYLNLSKYTQIIMLGEL